MEWFKWVHRRARMIRGFYGVTVGESVAAASEDWLLRNGGRA